MKITLCGSTAFINEMEALAIELDALGHEVQFPPIMVPGPDGSLIHTSEYYKQKKALGGDDNAWIWQNHSERIKDHFKKVVWSDPILVTNYDKNNIVGYIGPNTLMEMGLAFHLDKPIFLLNKIPDIAYREEVIGMGPKVLEGDLNRILAD